MRNNKRTRGGKSSTWETGKEQYQGQLHMLHGTQTLPGSGMAFPAAQSIRRPVFAWPDVRKGNAGNGHEKQNKNPISLPAHNTGLSSLFCSRYSSNAAIAQSRTHAWDVEGAQFKPRGVGAALPRKVLQVMRQAGGWWVRLGGHKTSHETTLGGSTGDSDAPSGRFLSTYIDPNLLRLSTWQIELIGRKNKSSELLRGAWSLSITSNHPSLIFFYYC